MKQPDIVRVYTVRATEVSSLPQAQGELAMRCSAEHIQTILMRDTAVRTRRLPRRCLRHTQRNIQSQDAIGEERADAFSWGKI